MKSSRLRFSLLAAALVAALAACGGSDDPTPITPVEVTPQATLVGRYAFNVSAGMSEIVAYHEESRSVFITVDTPSIPSSFQRVSLRGLTSSALPNPTTASNLESGALTPVAAHVNDSGFTAGGVQTLAISGNLLAIAVQATPKTANGVVAFYRLDDRGNATYLGKVEVGSLPDGMAFSPDGSQLVVANEGEIDGNQNFVLAPDRSNDPLGTISIIAIDNGTPADTALTLDFTAFDDGGPRAAELPADVRIGIAGNDFSRDAEPEYVSISDDGNEAYVTLQENNAVAVVDLRNNRIDRIIAMGYKDHSLPGNALAPSDRVPATAPFELKSYPNLFGIYMPDAIASFSINGTPYFITANEGDDRDDFLATAETSRVSSLMLDPVAFPNAAELRANTELGRLTVINTLGRNGSGQYEALYALGGRSFSIYNASTGAQVYDSGFDLEQRAYATLPAALLGAPQVLGRLDNKGPEPESVVVGRIGTRTYAFVALERTSAILMYDVSDPAAPTFVQWLQNTTNLVDGDISPEGLAFVPADRSPTGAALLLAGHEVSGSLAVWEIR
ncbi:MAG TPA: choice-of-anchor I family protein [Hydrogenophaga sp.]|uniref:choice-of-anchor I family protein n=1 Tax=Hydrogenophaga sp. TaxID=1904254 RepID=UPI002C359A50|nr:choice-of-anchor I family protein [Hydrogenophaga sp.]HMN93927.1 choice-of-anchor I family protein [Hydrogenophaga sp.]HMP12043.1 choice-of-anchor I family protein [Hydrogenophaga sp.]